MKNENEIDRHTPLANLPTMLTPQEARLWLGIGRDGSYDLARKYGVKVAGSWRIPRAVLERMAEERG